MSLEYIDCKEGASFIRSTRNNAADFVIRETLLEFCEENCKDCAFRSVRLSLSTIKSELKTRVGQKRDRCQEAVDNIDSI